MRSTFRALAGVAAALLTATAMPAFAAAPETTLVEGILQGSGGGPAADGTYSVTFAIFDKATGGTAAWTEGPVKLAIKGGRFSHRLGSTTKIDAGKLAALAGQFLEIKVDGQATARSPLNAVAFSIHAKTAGDIACSGCLAGKHVANGSIGPTKVNFAYAAAADGVKGGDAKQARALKCTGCVNTSHLKFDADVDMGANALKVGKLTAAGDLIAGGIVAGKQFVGDGSKLTGIKTPAGACKQGQVVQGINGDGFFKCVAAAGSGIGSVSNGVFANQYSDELFGSKKKPLTDNNPEGTLDTIDFPDVGLAQSLEIDLELNNSNTADLVILLFPPDAPVLPKSIASIVKSWPTNPNVDGGKYKHYILHKKKQFDAKDKTVLKSTWPTKTKEVAGNIHGDWLNKNIKGKWRLLVLDAGFKDNKIDGELVAWSIRIKTLSGKAISLKGSLHVDNAIVGPYKTFDKLAPGLKLKIGDGSKTKCTVDAVGMIRYMPVWGLQICQPNVDNKNKVSSYVWAAAKPRPITWSGGCKSHSQGSGWATYCLDGWRDDTAVKAGYITVNKNGTVTVKIAGYYQFAAYADQHGSGSKRLQMFVNGAGRAYVHNDENYGHRWGHTRMTQFFRMRAGDTFYVRYHADASNPYRWHSWNTSGNHSKLQIRYMGPMQ